VLDLPLDVLHLERRVVWPEKAVLIEGLREVVDLHEESRSEFSELRLGLACTLMNVRMVTDETDQSDNYVQNAFQMT
jgi:hypothetical protein